MSPASAPRPSGAKASSRPTVVARQVGMILSRRGARFSVLRRASARHLRMTARPWAEARGGTLKRAPRLEIDLELRLALTLRIDLVIDHLTEVRIGERVGCRPAQDHPVQQIEIRHAQFRFHMFADPELLAQRYVFIQVPRTTDIEDPRRRSQHPETGIGEGCCIYHRQSLIDVAVRELLLDARNDISAVAWRTPVP